MVNRTETGMKEEAKCPYCEKWFEVESEGVIVPMISLDDDGNELVEAVPMWGPSWWKDNSNGGGCPGCGGLVLVESECDFRKVAA